MPILSRLRSLNKNEFFKHGKNYIAGGFLSHGLTFLSIPILTRLLSPNDYGMIAVFVSMVAVFPVLIGLNFNGALSRKYYENDETYGEFIYTIIRFITFFGVLIVGSAILFVRPIAAFFNAPTQVFYIALGVSFVTLYWQFYQAHLMASLQSRTFAFISFLQAFVGLALTVGLILLISSKPYMGKLWAQAIVVGILSIYSLWKLRKLEKRRWHFSHVRYALHIGVPLIPHTLSYFVLASLDRIIINQLKDAGQTGLYALAYNIGSIVMIFVAALNSAWVPLLFKNLNDGNHEKIERTSNYYTMVVVFFALGLTLFSKEVLFIMASPKYHASLHIIPIIVLSSVLIFLYQLCVNYTFYVKKNIWISINTLVCGALNVVLNYRYIPEYGYTAAAYTTLVSYLLLFILNYLTARYYWGTKMLRFRFKLGFLVAVSISYYLLTLALGKVENYAIDFTLRLTLLTLVAGIIYLKAKNIQRQQNTPAN